MATSVAGLLGSATAPRCSTIRALARGARIVAAALLGLTLGAGFVASPALAHGEDEAQEGYLLVQQALGYLIEDPSAAGMDLAMEKVDDALAAEDHDGVAISELTQGKAALEAGDAVRARTLLQNSIKEALSDLPLATGNETGTTIVSPELPGRHGLTAQDWLFLVVSATFVAVGASLAYRFRPRDSVATLRRRLGRPSSRDAQDGRGGSGPLPVHGGS